MKISYSGMHEVMQTLYHQTNEYILGKHVTSMGVHQSDTHNTDRNT